MKKLLIILGLAIPLLLSTARAATPAQTAKAMNEFFAKYSGKKGYTTVELTGELLKAASQQPSGSNEAMDDILKDVERMRIVVAEKSSADFTVEVLDLPGKTDLKLVTNVNENGQRVRMYFKQAVPAAGGKKKQSAEFLMFILGPKDNLLIHITGEFDLKNVSKLAGISLQR